MYVCDDALWMWVRVDMHVCMRTCMHACMHACMCISLCVGGCMRMCMRVLFAASFGHDPLRIRPAVRRQPAEGRGVRGPTQPGWSSPKWGLHRWCATGTPYSGVRHQRGTPLLLMYRETNRTQTIRPTSPNCAGLPSERGAKCRGAPLVPAIQWLVSPGTSPPKVVQPSPHMGSINPTA